LTVALLGEVSQPSETMITNVTILDGRGSSARTNSTVVIANGKIAEIRSGTLPAARRMAVIDGHSGFLVPGFIDMHAHLMFPRCEPQKNGTLFDRAVSERMMSVLLDFGITTVRSPATPTIEGLQLRDDLNDGRARGPRAMASAELINDPAL